MGMQLARLSRFPPFSALRAFHAAARHGQFNRAAVELGLSESAISHQIRHLEEFLSVRLFERRGPHVELTAAGARYFADIDPAMDRIGEATEAMRGPADRGRVTLTLPPTPASMWLIPNLGSFEAACPGVDLQLMTTTRLVDLRREQIDLALRYGRGGWARVDATLLLPEHAMPVCRPDYLSSELAANPAHAIRQCRLIVNDSAPDEWVEWSKAHDLPAPELDGALTLSHSDQVLGAAERGLGLAIGRRPLVDPMLRTGELVAPFGEAVPTRAAYYLCQPKVTTPPVRVRRVVAWLHELAAASEMP